MAMIDVELLPIIGFIDRADGTLTILFGKHFVVLRYPDLIQLPQVPTCIAEFILFPVAAFLLARIYIPDRRR